MDGILEYLLRLYDNSMDLFFGNSKILNHKTANDVLSEADLRLNEYFCSNIGREYKDADIIAEESSNSEMTDNLTFVIDPLDGTCNYSLGLRLCGIQIAVFKNKECLLSLIGLPHFSEVYYAIKGSGAYFNGERLFADSSVPASDGILELSDFYSVNSDICIGDQFTLVKNMQSSFMKTRLFGAACVDFTNLAKNKAQAYICYYRNIWDIAPGLLLVKEAGLLYSGIGKEYAYGDHSLIVANNRETLEYIKGEIGKLIGGEGGEILA